VKPEKHLLFFEIARVLVRLDQMVSLIVGENDRVM